MVVTYFDNLFTAANLLDMDDVLSCVETKVTQEINATLCRPYVGTEVEMALKGMHPHKPPGPDGFNAFFYQKYWHVVGKVVMEAVLSVLNGGTSPESTNHTNVALIPKKKGVDSMDDF